MQRLIAIGLAFYSFALIVSNLPHLPARIPTHFNGAGDADGWGSPSTLWFLLLSQVVTCGLFLLVPLLARRFPGAVNLGSRKLSDFSPEQRRRIMPLFDDMTGYMSLLLSLLFAFLLRGTIRAAFSPHPHLTFWWVLLIFLAAFIATVIYYMQRIFAVAGRTEKGNPIE